MKQIPSKVCLDIVMELFNKKKIDSNGFIDITKIPMDQKKIKAEEVLKRLRVATTENKVPPALKAEILTKYYVLNLLTRKDIDKSIHMGFSKPKDKIPFLYILLVIEELYSEPENREKLIALFNAIVAKLKSDLEYSGEELSEPKDLEEMDFRKAISSAIIFIVDGRMLDVDTLMDILRKRSLKGKVTGMLLTTVLFDLLEKEKILLNRCISELKTCLVANQISASDFVQFLSALVNDEKITKEQYATLMSRLVNDKQVDKETIFKLTISLLKEDVVDKESFLAFTMSLLKEDLVDKESFFTFMMSLQKEDLVDKESFLAFTMSLLKEDLIDESTALPIIQSIIDKFKITKKDMANITDVVDKKLYKKMKFHSDKGDK